MPVKTDPERFILENTSLLRPPHVPEIQLYLASEVHELWHKTEDDLERIGLPPPFWAFAWAGGQGLARYILDHPETVRGRTVLDFASGSGLVAIAAAMAGACQVVACDIDPWSRAAMQMNAAVNAVDMSFISESVLGQPVDSEVILAGDVFYERDLADACVKWFEALTRAGKTVLAGDPGRTYRPTQALEVLAVYDVPVTRIVEDSEIKRTSVLRFPVIDS